MSPKLGDTIKFNINNLQGLGQIYHVDAKKPRDVVYHVYNGDKTGGFKVMAKDIVEVVKKQTTNETGESKHEKNVKKTDGR